MGRWIDLAQQESTPNTGGDMDEQRGVVLHIAEGSYDGTIAWQKNPASDVSSHFVAAKDGRAAQMVDTDRVAWTQKAGNGHWLSIENEGFVPDTLTAGQIEFAAQILARAHLEYGVPLQVATSPEGRGLGHHSMGSHPGYPDDWGHSSCPGANIINQKAAIVARAKEIAVDPLTEGQTAHAVWHVDSENALDNTYFPEYADSPAHTPPGSNKWIAGQTGLVRVYEQAVKALEQAQANTVKLDALTAKVDELLSRPAGSTTGTFAVTGTLSIGEPAP